MTIFGKRHQFYTKCVTVVPESKTDFRLKFGENKRSGNYSAIRYFEISHEYMRRNVMRYNIVRTKYKKSSYLLKNYRR